MYTLQSWKAIGKKLPRFNYMKNFKLTSDNNDKLLLNDKKSNKNLNLFDN